MLRPIAIIVIGALSVVGCGGSDAVPSGLETPERAVVTWFEAIDADDASAATAAVNDASLAVLLAVENDVDAETLAAYLESGVPEAVAADYWASFSVNFAEFASRPISSLTVGEGHTFDAQGATYAAVPISAGPGAESIVFARDTGGAWEIDLVATLADGFGSLLADRFVSLGSDATDATIRSAYLETVAPALWAAMIEGEFGDEFNRVALTLVDDIEG